MLTLCCPFIEYNQDVKRTLISFKSFINESYKISTNLDLYILAISSKQKDLSNKELKKLVDQVDYIPKLGVYFAYNQAIKKSFTNKSDWLWILGAGDTIFLPSKEQLNCLSNKQNKEKIIVGSMIVGDRKKQNRFKIARTNLWFNLDKMRLNHPAMIIPTKIYKEIGFYDKDKEIISDYEWCIKALVSKIKFIKLKNTFTYHELGGISTNYGKSRLRLHYSCIKMLYSNLGFSLHIFIAFISRILRFMFSRITYYIKKIYL